MRKQMILSVFLSSDANYHMAGWRHPAGERAAAFDFAPWIEFARTLERGKIDMLFVADGSSAYGVDDPEQFTRIARNFGFEPFTLVSALASVTHDVGLALTASTTWYEPYTVARMFASLDRISGGRAGWNVVTSRNPEDALNYSRDSHVEHDLRYRRAEEFMDVCFGLWDSYDDDAFVLDPETGRYLHPDRYRLLRHKGAQFSVKGPLNVPRPVQGRPVIIQAGQSGPGMDLAARVADCVFTVQPDPDSCRLFSQDIKARAARFGRPPDALKVLPGVSIYCDWTRAAAQRKFDELQQLVPASFAIKALGALLGEDFSVYPADGPIPPLKPNPMYQDPEHTARKARDEGMTLAQFAVHMTTSKSHNILIGTPAEVCDALEHWFVSDACDGFNLLPPIMPGGLDDFVDLVVPELQRRRLFHRDYAGGSLREKLGLDRPADVRHREATRHGEIGA